MVATSLVDSQGRYEISNLQQHNITLTPDSFERTEYLLEFLCGDVLYQRFVTGVEDQDLSEANTLLSWLLQSEAAATVPTLSAEKWHYFYDKLAQTESLTEAFSTLQSNAKMKESFESTFGITVDGLKDVPPKLSRLVTPKNLSEGQAHKLLATGIHWSGAYTTAYMWRIGSDIISNSNQLQYVPSADKQGQHILQLFVGQDDGLGQVNFAKPYIQRNFDIEISNNLPATAPSLSLTSDSFTNNINVSAEIVTGSLVDGRPSQCHSFTGMAVVESMALEPLLPPVSEASYGTDCTSVNTQVLSFTLSGAEGARAIRLWVRDSTGNISAVPQQIIVNYDITDPVLSWTESMTGLSLRGGQSFNIRWTSVEANADTVDIAFSSDGGSNWSSVVDGGADDGSHIWTVPSVNSTQGRIRITAHDRAGNSTTLVSPDLVIDSVAPGAPSLILQSPATTNSLQVEVRSQNCNDTTQILLNENLNTPTLSDSDWQNCSTADNRSITLTAGDGSRTIYTYARDVAGNISNVGNFSVFVDQTAPSLSLTNMMGGEFLSGSSTQVPLINTQNVTYTVSDAGSGLVASPMDFRYSLDAGGSWQDIALDQAASGSFNWTVPEVDVSTARFQVEACDLAGNCRQVSSSTNFTIDSSAPVATSIDINSGALVTDNFYVSVDLEAEDNLSEVSEICLLKTTVVPEASDPCWKPTLFYGTSSASSVNVSIPNYLLGFSAGFFNVKTFYKDRSGNISELSSSGSGTLGKDLYTIQYQPGTPPVVGSIVALNDNSLTKQPSLAQTTFAGGQSVYIKWHVTDDYPLPSNNINLYYTTDEVNYHLIESNVDSTASSGCTVDGGTTFTGCYLWSTPGAPASYFKVRIEVTDSLSVKTISSTSGLNTQIFKVLAGNTDPGLGGSASSAVLYSLVSNEAGDLNSIVLDKSGVFYFKDLKRGILKVDPSTGLLTQFIPKTGSYSGEGGPAEAATLNSPKHIAIDKKDRLVIYDHNRILRVEEDGTIHTLVGGGATDTSGTLGTSYALTTFTRTFMVAPNDDIYFADGAGGDTPDTGFRLKYYKNSDQRVYHIHLTGTGTHEDPSQTINDKRFHGIGIDFASNGQIQEIFARVYRPVTGGAVAYSVSFDPSTGLSLGAGTHRPRGCVDAHGNDKKFQSASGAIYEINERCKAVYKLNKAANTWDVVFGSGRYGRCEDDTVATDCPNAVDDIFVDSNEQLYFLDNGMVRTVVDGKVQTIFGNPLSSESTPNPLSMRFSAFQQIGSSANDKIVINDHVFGYLWEIPRTGDVLKLAGNGITAKPVAGLQATAHPFATNNWTRSRLFAIHPVTNDIYIHGRHSLGCDQPIRLDRSTGNWTEVMTGCGSSYWAGDGQTDSRTHYIGWSMLGFDSSLNLVGSTSHWSGIHEKGMVKGFNVATGEQFHLMGADAPTNTSNLPPDGTDMGTTTSFPQHAWGSAIGSAWDGANSRWLVGQRSSKRIAAIPVAANTAGNISTLTTTDHAIVAFAYRVEAGDPIVYYCATDGRVYRRDVNGAAETALAWPSPTISCKGKTMSINANLNRLEIIFEQNGLYGVAELQL